MRALICIREKDYAWVTTTFPGRHPAMIRICNKPLLEYLIDFVILNGCTEVRLILDEPSAEIERYFGSGSRLGIEVSFSNSKPSDSIDTLLEKNSKFCQDEHLLILDGFFFIHYDKEQDYRNWQEISYTGRMSNCPTGTVLFVKNSAEMKNISSVLTEVEFALSALESIEDIFQITMQVLAAEQNHYVLPGYSADKGIILGRNVEIGKDVTVNSPVIIGNNVRLLGEAVIGPCAVIENNVIIDSGSQIEESCVFEGSYLGRDLSVHSKIISGKTIYDGLSGESLNITDAFLLSEIHPVLPWQFLRRLTSSVSAMVLTLLLCVPYLFIGLLLKSKGDYHRLQLDYYCGHNGETLQVNTIVSNNQTFIGKLYSTLYLDRIPLLAQVIRGKIRLMGNSLLPVTDENMQLLKDFPEYAPGAFSYSEADDITPGTIESEVAERFYAAHRSVILDLRMLAKIFFTGPYSKKHQL